jgi:enoyl-[acyl-carrier-protein] reductase (NADH)
VIEPSEIGELAAFLLSDRSKCITGANIFADGGMTSQLIIVDQQRACSASTISSPAR